MNQANRVELNVAVSRRERARARIAELHNQGLFPENIVNQNNRLIVNLCVEERWAVDGNDQDTNQFVTNSGNSLLKIEKVMNLLDHSLHFNHRWSANVTYIDLIKVVSKGVVLRLRYEIDGRVLTVKWLIVDTQDGEDKVYVSIAKNSIQILHWEEHFLNTKALSGGALFRHQKYFLLDSEGSPLDDYIINDLDGDRVEVTIEDNQEEIGIYLPNDFLGVFVQDRYKLPVEGDDKQGLIGFKEIMELIKNELLTVQDHIEVLKKYGLISEGLRLELESCQDENTDNEETIEKLEELKSQVQLAISTNGLGNIANKM
jgi:hypothetical protein